MFGIQIPFCMLVLSLLSTSVIANSNQAKTLASESNSCFQQTGCDPNNSHSCELGAYCSQFIGYTQCVEIEPPSPSSESVPASTLRPASSPFSAPISTPTSGISPTRKPNGAPIEVSNEEPTEDPTEDPTPTDDFTKVLTEEPTNEPTFEPTEEATAINTNYTFNLTDDGTAIELSGITFAYTLGGFKSCPNLATFSPIAFQSFVDAYDGSNLPLSSANTMIKNIECLADVVSPKQEATTTNRNLQQVVKGFRVYYTVTVFVAQEVFDAAGITTEEEAAKFVADFTDSVISNKGENAYLIQLDDKLEIKVVILSVGYTSELEFTPPDTDGPTAKPSVIPCKETPCCENRGDSIPGGEDPCCKICLPSFAPTETPSAAPSCPPESEQSCCQIAEDSISGRQDPCCKNCLPSFAPTETPSAAPSCPPESEQSCCQIFGDSISGGADPCCKNCLPSETPTETPTETPSCPPESELPCCAAGILFSAQQSCCKYCDPTDTPTATPTTAVPTETPTDTPTKTPTAAPSCPPASQQQCCAKDEAGLRISQQCCLNCDPTLQPTATPTTTAEPTATPPTAATTAVTTAVGPTLKATATSTDTRRLTSSRCTATFNTANAAPTCLVDADCCNAYATCSSDGFCHLACTLPVAPVVSQSPIDTQHPTSTPAIVHDAASLTPFQYIKSQIFVGASSSVMSDAQATAYSKSIAILTKIDASDVHVTFKSKSASQHNHLMLDTHVYQVVIIIDIAHEDVPAIYQDDYASFTTYLDGVFASKSQELLSEYKEQLALAGLPDEDTLNILSDQTATTRTPTFSPSSTTESSSSTTNNSNFNDGQIAIVVVSVLALAFAFALLIALGYYFSSLNKDASATEPQEGITDVQM